MSLLKSLALTIGAAVMLHLASPAGAQTAAGRELPLVWVLSTGGTISGQGASSTSLAEYKSGALLSEQLVAGVDHVGLGSDFDGATMPVGMDDASQLPKLTTWPRVIPRRTWKRSSAATSCG